MEQRNGMRISGRVDENFETIIVPAEEAGLVNGVILLRQEQQLGRGIYLLTLA
jgi:hypothetical protein